MTSCYIQAINARFSTPDSAIVKAYLAARIHLFTCLHFPLFCLIPQHIINPSPWIKFKMYFELKKVPVFFFYVHKIFLCLCKHPKILKVKKNKLFLCKGYKDQLFFLFCWLFIRPTVYKTSQVKICLKMAANARF